MRPGLPSVCLSPAGPFQPCEHLFESWGVRLAVWAVVLLALLCNALVLLSLSVAGPGPLPPAKFVVGALAGANALTGLSCGLRGEGGSRDLGGKEGTAAPPRKGPRDSRASGTCRPGGAAEPLPGQGPVSKERGALQPAEVPFTPVVAGLRHKWDTVISFALPGLPLQHAHTHRHTCRGNPQEGSGG